MASALDILQVTARMILLGQEVLNVYHLLVGENAPDGDLAQDITERLDNAHGEMATLQDGSMAFDSIRIINVTDNTEVGEFDWPSLVGGSVAGTVALPPGVAGVVTFTTTTMGSRGRKFIAGFTESDISDGVWEAGTLAAMADYAAYIATPFVGTESGVPLAFGVRTAAGLFRSFNGYTVTNIPGYQRRRKQGVGS